MSRTIHLSNGIIITNPVSGAFCSSLTITDGIVTAHDSTLPDNAESIDLQHCVAVPGFIDSHLHLVLGATGLGDVDLNICHSKQSFQEALLQAAHSLPESQWLIGSGWSQQRLGEMPNITWFANNEEVPIICYSSDLHCAVLNKNLLRHLDIKLLQEMPGGQRIEQGIAMEDALFEGVLPVLPENPTEVKIDRTAKAMHALHSKGITLVGTMEHKNEIDTVLVPLQSSELVRVRIICLDEPTVEMIEACNQVKQNEFLQITGFKTFVDGSFGSRTAKMYSGWLDTDGDGVWAGHAAKDTLEQWVTTVSRAGYAPVLHAIGDAAVGRALKALDSVSTAVVSRIEHAQCIAECDFSSLSGKWFGVQPLHQPDDAAIAIQALGVKQIGELHNWRKMIDFGGLLSFGSDWPVVPFDPIDTMSIAIERGLSPQEAFVSSTTLAAQSLRTQDAGHLRIGAYGDIAVLDTNPLDCDWKDDIPSVTMTLQAGRTVYKKE